MGKDTILSLIYKCLDSNTHVVYFKLLWQSKTSVGGRKSLQCLVETLVKGHVTK